MNDSWEMLNRLANLAQIADFTMDLQQLSNDDLMKHLLEQDKILDEQTNIYLKKIVEQNEVIINLLKGVDKHAQDVFKTN